MKITENDILLLIKQDWGNNPQSKICIAILDFLKRTPIHDLTHITYGSLRKVIDTNFDEAHFLTSIQYLCGDRTSLLEMRFELFIEERDEVFEVSKSEINCASKTGFLIHPETGIRVEDFRDKIFVFFAPGQLIKDLKNNYVR